MFFGTLTIAKDGFSMVFGSPNCWFQWFLMVKDHWSNNGMESIDRSGLIVILLFSKYVVWLLSLSNFVSLKFHFLSLMEQGYTRVDLVARINIEDLEDIGFCKLGHQKRLVSVSLSILITCEHVLTGILTRCWPSVNSKTLATMGFKSLALLEN